VEKVSINDSLEEMVRKIRANGGPPIQPGNAGGDINAILEHVSAEPISDEEIEEFLRTIYADRRAAGKVLPTR